MRHERGFTLIELLVALGVFAVLSAASVGIIRIATNAQERAGAVAEDLAEVERLRAILRADFLQMSPRPFREPLTSGTLGPVIGGPAAQAALPPPDGDEEILMAFVRNGWANPGYALPRASLQQVTYLTDGSRLIRRVRPFLDAASETPTRDDVLIEGVSDVAFEFYGPQGWQPDLPPSESVPAIRLLMTHPGLGELTQDFLAGGAP